MRSRQPQNGVVALVALFAVAMGAAGCSGGAPSPGDGAAGAGGGRDGAAGTSGSAGAGKGDSGAAGAEAPAVCVPPATQGGSAGIELEFRSTWCNSTRSCATCVWDVIETVPTLNGTFVPITTTCTFAPIVCPATSGTTAASLPSCSYRPDAGHYDGTLLSGYPTASECQAINGELVGINSFPFETSPCTLAGFVCVADCAACP